MTPKLYIWRDVLWGYVSGAAVAIARSPDEARAQLLALAEESRDVDAQQFANDLRAEPEVRPVNAPFALYVPGSD